MPNFVTIPIHAFSKKIITKRFGPGPIKPRQGSILHKHLKFVPVENCNESSQSNFKRKPNDTLQIYLPRRVFARIKKNGCWNEYAQYIDDCYNEQLNYFIMGAVMNGGTASQAIRNFCNFHNITEDDYSFDAAYKSWQRFEIKQKRNVPLLAQKNVPTLNPNRDKLRNELNAHLAYNRKLRFRYKRALERTKCPVKTLQILQKTTLVTDETTRIKTQLKELRY